MEIVCIKRHDFCFSCDFVPEPQDEKERDAEIGRNDISPVDMRCEKCLVVLGECHNQANGNGKNRAERIPFRSVRKFIERVPLREKSFAEPVMANADAEPENKAGDAIEFISQIYTTPSPKMEVKNASIPTTAVKIMAGTGTPRLSSFEKIRGACPSFAIA